MNKTFTVDEFIRFAFDDLKQSEQAYLKSGTTDMQEMIPSKFTMNIIFAYMKVLEVIRFGEKKINLIIN